MRIDNRPDALDFDLARQRLNSPKYPTFAEALVIRQRKRENLAGRILLAATVASGFIAIVNFPLGLLGLAFFGTGLVACCYVAGSRHDKRNGGRP